MISVLFIDIFLGFFSDLFNIVFFIIAILIGIIVGIVLFRVVTRPKNQIIYCRERDGRAMELDIAKEDHISLETKTDPPLRFFKFGRSYELRKRGRAYTRFFGKEGTAYTWLLKGFEKVKGKPKQIEVKFESLAEAVKSVCGEAFYQVIPPLNQAQMENRQLLVTVDLETGITPEGYSPITESVILNKADEDAAKLWAESIKGAIKKGVIDIIPWVLAGAGIMAIASKLLGWW